MTTRIQSPQDTTETPTPSRGRPALPFYRRGVSAGGCHRSAVDNSGAVDNPVVSR
jgi:hypothetical protein